MLLISVVYEAEQLDCFKLFQANVKMVLIYSVAVAPAGFQARVGKIRREAPKKNFRLPTLVFSLPTLPYVTVAHPAHRTEADLTNQEGPSPPLPLT